MISRHNAAIRSIQAALNEHLDRYGYVRLEEDGVRGPLTINVLSWLFGDAWFEINDGAQLRVYVRSAGAPTMADVARPDHVRDVQRELEIDVDGALGPQTWRAITAEYPEGARWWRLSFAEVRDAFLGVTQEPTVEVVTPTVPVAVVTAQRFSPAQEAPAQSVPAQAAVLPSWARGRDSQEAARAATRTGRRKRARVTIGQRMRIVPTSRWVVLGAVGVVIVGIGLILRGNRRRR